MKTAKPLASLSLDLDNKWSYLKTHGDAGWEKLPTYLPLVVPRILDFLQSRGLTITFFIVGQDADQPENADALRTIADAGHEIGNHSYHHEPWLHLYSEGELRDEVGRAEETIERVTGRRPIGFRGPGFSLSDAALKVLIERSYRYDGSTFPTFLGPLARAYYFMSAKLSKEERAERKALFGSFWEGFRSNRAYRWMTRHGPLLEIPVTTMPLFRVPIHVSYLLYLSLYAPWLARCYFRTALHLCRLTSTTPSLLLHPLDFLGADDDTDLAFFPAMGVPHAVKLGWLHDLLGIFTHRFQVVTMREQADWLMRERRLKSVAPSLLKLPTQRIAAVGADT
jgi:peptidoglycan-N-acetylglucosamine deacetylase